MEQSPSPLTSRNAVRYALPEEYNGTSKEDMLDAVSTVIRPEKILAASLTGESFTVYLATYEDALILLRKKIELRGQFLIAVHLVNVFTVFNVPPPISNDILDVFFCKYGAVQSIQILPFCPNSLSYKHVMSPDRRIFMEVPLHDPVTYIPEDIVIRIEGNKTLAATVKQHCVFCEADGHAYSNCEQNGIKLFQDDKKGLLPDDSSKYVLASSGDSPIYLPSSTFQYLPQIEKSFISPDSKSKKIAEPCDVKNMEIEPCDIKEVIVEPCDKEKSVEPGDDRENVEANNLYDDNSDSTSSNVSERLRHPRRNFKKYFKFLSSDDDSDNGNDADKHAACTDNSCAKKCRITRKK